MKAKLVLVASLLTFVCAPVRAEATVAVFPFYLLFVGIPIAAPGALGALVLIPGTAVPLAADEVPPQPWIVNSWVFGGLNALAAGGAVFFAFSDNDNGGVYLGIGAANLALAAGCFTVAAMGGARRTEASLTTVHPILIPSTSPGGPPTLGAGLTLTGF